MGYQTRSRVLKYLQQLKDQPGDQVLVDRDILDILSQHYQEDPNTLLLQSQAALREKKDKLLLAEKIAGIGYWYWKVGAENMMWSNQVYYIHGVDPDTFTPNLEAALSAYHPDDRPGLEAQMKDCIREKKGFQYERRVIRPDGEVRDVFSKGLVEIDLDGKVSALYGVFQDITDRNKTEMLEKHYRSMLETEVREQTRRLKEANTDLRNLTYIVSHDLRSPLVNIKGFVSELEYIQNEMKDMLLQAEGLDQESQQRIPQIEEEAKEAIHFIHAGAEKMDRLIASILRFSRLGSRQMHLRDVDLNHIAKQNLEAMGYQMDANQVTAVLNSLPVVHTDEDYMELILGNLLSNAIKYLKPEVPGRIEIGSEESAEAFTIYVKDNGSGIAPADHERIFELFRRAGSGTQGGEGLGLAFVRMAVRRCGGSIHVQSELDKGSTFYFSLPKKID